MLAHLGGADASAALKGTKEAGGIGASRRDERRGGHVKWSSATAISTVPSP